MCGNSSARRRKSLNRHGFPYPAPGHYFSFHNHLREADWLPIRLLTGFYGAAEVALGTMRRPSIGF